MAKSIFRYNPFDGKLDQFPVYGDQFSEAFDASISTTTSTTFQEKLLLNVGILKNGAIYYLETSYKWNHDATNNDFESRVIDISSNELDHLDGHHKQEPQDSSGNWEGTGSAQRYGNCFRYRIVGSGVADEFRLQYRTDSNGAESSIFDAIMSFKRVK